MVIVPHITSCSYSPLSGDNLPINEFPFVGEEVLHREVTTEYHADALGGEYFLIKKTL